MRNWITRLTGTRASRRMWLAEETTATEGMEWRRIAWLTVDIGRSRNRIPVSPASGFRSVKLRSLGTDVEICRWVLTFDDGSLQDLSVNCLFRGTESRPLSVTGRRLMGMVVDYEARSYARRGRIEIWAQP